MARNLDTPINVRHFGAKGDNTTDDTAAIQKAIDAGIVSGRTVYIPSGMYKITNLTIIDELTICGDHPESKYGAPFGTAGYSSISSNVTGSWLRSTVTTGNAVTVGTDVSYTSAKVENIGIVGPGSGTSSGLKLKSANRSRFSNIYVINFSKGLDNLTTIDCNYSDIRAWGCETGIYLSGAHQSVFTNTDLQFNKLYAIRITATEVCAMLGGVTEDNSGTPVMIEGSNNVAFQNWYFEDFQGPWPAPITNNIFISSDSSLNSIRDCHFTDRGIYFDGSHNHFINNSGVGPITLAGVGNVVIGPLYGTLTETLPGLNVVVDPIGERVKFPGDLEIGAKLSGAASVKILVGTGSPEGVATAKPGSLYLNRSGGAGTTLYVKQSGTGNTGWIGK